MRLIIAGSRSMSENQFPQAKIAKLVVELGVTQIIAGGQTGADTWARNFALDGDINFREFRANWGAFGDPAGPIRNRDMASNADAVLLLPGGKGTESMAAAARLKKLKIIDWRAESGLKDTDPMPFGKHKGVPMEDVPARYLHWIWTEGGKNQKSPVPEYIRRNLSALKMEYPNGIWD